MDLIKLTFIILVAISAYDFFNKYMPKKSVKKPASRVEIIAKIRKKTPAKKKKIA